ncbi:MAG: bifunctional adenosylcobinamide kinase/adenosylcobinamide-phosphate guanylyltransferase [Synergistaceae bacterium]|jgi:adenosylcobinamide kinase/adenosylcobinamide-phosphate guanylyltransferase|nr:bifunctional adenosylcobinamide kinase/adenosylcobinamide-phosphate guanylyltransferase [Synergistaceae bacterium]
MITFVLGGSASGKSEFAERIAREARGRIIYLATADESDAEMESRIAVHKARRPASWDTWEGPVETLPDATRKLAAGYDLLLLDCLTTYISALFMSSQASDDEIAWAESEKKILNSVSEIFTGFAETARDVPKHLIVVSDEVGCGVVPAYPMGRRFRDLQGRANQTAAALSDEAVFVAAGLPFRLKTGSIPGTYGSGDAALQRVAAHDIS